MVAQETSLLIIAIAQVLVFVIMFVGMMVILPRLGSLLSQIESTLAALKGTLNSTDEVVKDVQNRRVIEKLLVALSSASGAVDKVEPLASELKETMAGARGLLDDATQTSLSVRNRIEDLAATQTELNSLVKALTDVSCDLRDNDLARKLTNVLGDASLLAADIGILTENANSYLESGKPLVDGISNVVSNAKERASGITSSIDSLKEGMQSSAKGWPKTPKE